MDERGWQTVAWGVAAIVAVLLGLRMLGPAQPAPPVQVPRADAAAARGGERDRRSGPYVHVAGAVRKPGAYRLAEGTRVHDAVRRAGGPTAAADLAGVNLAAPLQDGQQVVVPERAPDGGVAATAAGGAGDTVRSHPAEPDAPGYRIGLGSATAEQLEELDGIGPTLAARIVAERQARGGFASLDQLGEVDGIGEERLEALKQALPP